MNPGKHSEIFDIVLDTSKGKDFECHLAVKAQNITQVQFYEINSPENLRTISYVNKGGKIQVKLSDDASLAFFTNVRKNIFSKVKFRRVIPQLRERYSTDR